MFKVITFYKYAEIEDPRELMDSLNKRCRKLNLLGRILIACEGINGGVCGESESIEKFKERLKERNEFNDMSFREQEFEKQAYHKLVIRVRDEVVVFDKKVNLENKGNDITSAELKKLLDNNEETVLLDARNDYEYKLGKFKDARTLKIKNFREFPNKINEIKDLKDKKIVMYCTGGIRCEKASAYLKENGFKDVNKLKGGIIEFINKYPKTYFEGGLFVFDDRIVSQAGDPITKCKHCNKECDVLINCHNLDCDKLHISCEDCQSKMNSCCSEECVNAERHRQEPIII